ncbi:hypothetical protein JHK85_038103 [Glycine max]|nr:hypothetical protein JHK85_038103 [Glycine max]
MKNSLVIAFSITICSIAFVISKIVISVLLYKRWRRKHLIHEEGYPGGKIVIFRSSGLKSLKADVILKKTQKLNSKDIIGSGNLLLYQVKAVVRDKKEELVLDNSLGSCSMQEVNKVFSIAMMCLEPDPLKRPTMAEVVSLLEQTEADKLITAS